MATQEVTLFSGTSASAPGTVAQTGVAGFGGLDDITIIATLAGPTGGSLDVYVQRSADNVTFYDYAHFQTVLALAGAATFSYQPAPNDNFVQIGSGTTPALAAGTGAGGKPYEYLRVLLVSNAGVSAGAAQNIRVLTSRR